MASAECKPITGVTWKAPSGVKAESLVGVRGVKPPEAESFLRIRHPKEGANWLHVRVLNDRNCNFREWGL